MDTQQKTIADLSAVFREQSLAPGSVEVPDILPACKAFIKLVRKHRAGPAFPDPTLAEATLHIYRMLLATKDLQLVQAGLHCLLVAGRFGRTLAARFVYGKSIAERELSAKLLTLSASVRLALAHEMLLDFPGNYDKQTQSWIEELMGTVVSAPPDEVVPFMAALGEEGTSLAFPARQALMSGTFGKWITTKLKTGASGDDLDTICHIVTALHDHALAETLAVSMGVGFIQPTTLALNTVATVAEAGTKPVLDMFLKVLKKSGPALAGPCLNGIIAQQTPVAGKLLATIRQKMPSLKKAAMIRVPLLDEAGYKVFVKAVPQAETTQAEGEAFSALMALAPDFVESLARTGTAIGGKVPPEENETEADETPAAVEPTCPGVGFLAKLFGKKPKTLERLLPKMRSVRNENLMCSNLEKEELESRELVNLDLSNSRFTEVTFLRTKLSQSKLSNATFTGGKAAGCTFSKDDFSGAEFSGVCFTNCSFNDCTFTASVFSNCTFRECKFRNCTLTGSAILSSFLRNTGFTTSALGGVSIFDTNIKSSRFDDVDFTGADFTSSVIKGAEFISSVFLGTTIYGSVFHSTDMPGSTVRGCLINNSDVCHALFLSNQVTQLYDFANKLDAKVLPNPNAVQPEVARKVLLAWSRELTILRREERMQAHNRRRLALAISSMDREKQVFVRILPHLLNTDIFEKAFKLDGVPPCDVWGYTPALTSLELADQYFPDEKPSKTRPTVLITAVYAMGSLGTVAQTAESDLDCWVCYEGDVNLNEETGLKRKLDALGLWAESQFGLEAHFFPMRMEDVQDNRFASGDEESSGSAQALLLKEEFYRTALRMAGKNLAWWVCPADADEAAYDECVQATRRYPLSGRPRMADFGHLGPVPPTEYFGGSLWQMVKAVHSPFKSVLKLGLLETYADPKASPLPLCSRIKNNLFLRRHGVKRTDPYASLFTILRAYYLRRGDKEAAKLLTESFMFKANMCDMPFFRGLPARPEDASLVAALFGEGYVDPEKICNSDMVWTFDKSLKMGGSVRNYMVNVYQRIQNTLSKSGKTDVMINSEDLTRMGRRIGANFSKKRYKIMRVPFMDSKGGQFTILHLSAEKAPGKKAVWVTRGGTKAEAKKSVDSLQILHRSGDPTLMFSWLLANRIYTPASLLQADRSIAPISLADLQKLMPSMHEFFDYDETFERDINEGLEAERVVRAFLIFNLLMPPETQSVEQVSVVYSTNWGEMYCRTFLKPNKMILEHPSRFLAANLDHAVPGPPEMQVFLPKGSQCRRPNLI